MSDLPVRKKGLRTFASDFERAKDATSKSPVPPTKKTTAVKPSKLPEPAKKIPAPPKPIFKTIQKPYVPKKIPAFHEIEKTLEDIDLSDTANQKKTHQVKHRTKSITPNRRVGGGAIITDTKTSSFSLFGEIRKSITNWFNNRNKKSAPKLAVSKADRRKGVIQQATTKSGTIFTADNETLKARIKARKQLEQHKPHAPETNWSPYTDTGYSLLESGVDPAVQQTEVPTTKNVVVEFKKRSTPNEEPVAPPKNDTATVPAPAVQQIVETITLQNDVPEPPIANPEEINNATPELAPDPKPVALPLDQLHIESKDGAQEPETPESTTVETYETDVEKNKLTTNQLTMYISGGVAVALVAGFFSWIVMNNETNSAVLNQPQIEKIVALATIEIITVDQTFTASELRSYSGVAPYTELVLQNSNTELLPAALVFALVTPEMPTAIQQFTTDVRFIQFGTEVPQLIANIVDPTSVTGALLMHESKIATALTPLYGQIDTGNFTDSTIAGTDVRVLVSGTRQTLTYGIINGKTLVIAISPDAFAEINNLFNN
jgi:hypothetical protein